MSAPSACLGVEDGVATITLNRPERHNALVPELLEDLRVALARAAAFDIMALILTGAGRSFSTGGDIAGFLKACDRPGGIAGYADRIVGLLNAAILDLLAFPVPVIARVNGAVTGGAVGLVLSSDIVLMAETAFIQPYYGEVGFAPDGGWTALLPERIGPARAIAAQALNQRIDAQAALELGLATRLSQPERLDEAVGETIATLRGMDRKSLSASRRLVWDESRRAAVAARLEAERVAFCDLVGRPEVLERMRAFTRRR
jgi:2-(1,2-epoxy-1,2-dihydrophenyl)acetyl-CoA isomerase